MANSTKIRNQMLCHQAGRDCKRDGSGIAKGTGLGLQKGRVWDCNENRPQIRCGHHCDIEWDDLYTDRAKLFAYV